MSSFFKPNEKYLVRVVDLHSPDAKTFGVSVNSLMGRYPCNEEVQIPGVLINALLDATVPQEIIKMDNGYPMRVGTKLIPRFSVTPVGMPPVPTAPATLVTPGVSQGTDTIGGQDNTSFDPDSEPGPESGPNEPKTQTREEELETMTKEELIDIAKDHKLDYTVRNNKSEMITGILAAEAAGV